MALTVTTTPEDIAVDLGRDPDSLDSITTAQWQRWIDDAARIIDKRIGDIVPDPGDLDYVIRMAVVSMAQAPAPGVESESVQIDDGGVTTRYRSATRRVEILPAWWELLGVKSGGAAFSIDMTAGCVAAHQPWCDVNMGGLDCSCGASLAGFPLWEY